MGHRPLISVQVCRDEREVMRDRPAKGKHMASQILYPTSPQTRGRRMVAPLMTCWGTQATRVEYNSVSSVRGCP